MDESASNEDPRVAVVTGAAGAIGGAVSRRFAEAGWRLALLDRPRNQSALRDRFPAAMNVPVDLSDASDAEAAVARVRERYGRLDALLNVVGGFAMRPAAEATLEDLERQLDANLRTAFNATRAALPVMLELGRGFVMGTAAAPAVRGAARMACYAAAKSAVAGYFRSVGAELEPKGIGVAVLYPMGTVDTPANREAMPGADPGSWIDPSELADAALFLAERSRRGRVRELMVYPG